MIRIILIRIIFSLFLLLITPAYAQQSIVIGPISPCSAFGTASGTCLQGAGALGTPSSGTVTNLTGTASININGTVGGTTPGAGAFTTINASGIVTAAAKSNQIGTLGGTASTGAVATTDANILLYNNSSTNWAGLGIDPSGQMWFKTGTSGTPLPAIYIDGAQAVHLQATTDATTSAGGVLQVSGGASIAKRFWIPTITTSSGLQTAVLCQSSGGEMIADSVACLASGSQFKKILGPMEAGALAKLMRLPIDRWEYKSEGRFQSSDWTRERVGPIAQDVALMDHRLAGYDKDGNIRTFSPDQLLAFTIKAVQEHVSETNALKACLSSWKCRLFGK